MKTQSPTILIIDDNHENLRLLGGILKEQGYTVRLAPDGNLGYQSALARQPDIILLDVMMSGIDGYDTCAKLKGDKRTNDIPVIFISALQEVFDKVKALSAGGVDYITKPFQVEEVLARVSTHVALGAMRKQLQEQNKVLLQEINERKEAVAALAEERALLSQRVEERTADLSAANAALSRASRLKDEFLASVTHELRTPLNTILGLSEALGAGAYGPLTEQQQEVLRIITQSGQRLLGLINDIIDLSRIEAGKMTLNVTRCDVRAVCEACVTKVRAGGEQKNHVFSVAVDDAVNWCEADERVLKHILANLLDNAVKFTPGGGSIGVEVVRDVARQAIRFTVWDTGIGISPENIGHLFKPFVQLDSGLARKFSGTGLGLILVYRLTRMHSGGVAVESEVDRGSRFTVSFLWQPPDDAAGETIADAGGFLRTMCVLLVDDDEYMLQTYSLYLSARGCKVVIARNATEMMDRVQENRPSVVVMGLQMGGVDNLETMRSLCATTDLADAPVVALSALVRPGDGQRCLDAGARLFSPKPVGVRGLGGMLREVLAGDGG